MEDLIEHVESRSSTTGKYLHYQNDYGHQTWQGGYNRAQAESKRDRGPN